MLLRSAILPFLLIANQASVNTALRGGSIKSTSSEHRPSPHRRLGWTPPSDSCNGSGLALYVSSSAGTDDSSTFGTSPSTPYRTLQYAVDNRPGPCTTIYVMPGTYRNDKYGTNVNHYKAVIKLSGVTDLIITNYGTSEEDRPLLEFDGPGGIICSSTNQCSNIEISGLEISGPNTNITHADAMSNRINPSTKYTGRGVAIWRGNKIYIHDMIVHNCPGSGIRVNKGDYVTVSDSVVYDNTWWSPRAESAIVLAESIAIDESNSMKMLITNNHVYGNVNKIPYYNPNYAWDYSPIGGYDCASFDECEAGEIDGCPWQCRYGKVTQDYIIDGSGVYVTRNKDTYTHGKMELSFNTCHSNGINGLVFHRTDRGTVRTNIIYDNGVVPRLDHPELIVEDWHLTASGKSRQPYSGLVLNNAAEVKLWSNNVAARYDDDYAFKQEDDSGTPTPVLAGGNNKACKGLVDVDPSSFVTSVSDLSICVSYIKIYCGERCHLIQWPYTMHASYLATTARIQCEADCDANDCKAFSLQYDYNLENGNKMCFLYTESAEPNPVRCASDPFNTVPTCSYPTEDGQFFVTPAAQAEYDVLDLVVP